MACVSDSGQSAKNKGCAQCGAPKSRAARFCSISCSTTAFNIERGKRSMETLWARFMDKVDLSKGQGPNGDCWHWTGRVDGRGYGEMKIHGKYVKAHRIALFGEDVLTRDEFACHHCDNPRCVKPAHLFAGTAKDNVQDMIKKGRAECTRRAKRAAAARQARGAA